MGDIGAVEPLTFLNERFRPDQLLYGGEPHGDIEDTAVGRISEPLIVHTHNCVARAVNHVDEELPRARLAKPVREGGFDGETSGFECLQRSTKIRWTNEKVEVLGVAFDARITRESVCAANQELDVRRFQRRERAAVERALVAQRRHGSIGARTRRAVARNGTQSAARETPYA